MNHKCFKCKKAMKRDYEIDKEVEKIIGKNICYKCINCKARLFVPVNDIELDKEKVRKCI